jgi:hypothetical protein
MLPVLISALSSISFPSDRKVHRRVLLDQVAFCGFNQEWPRKLIYSLRAALVR